MKLQPPTRHKLKLWAPALIGIPAMLALGLWLDVARYFLFAHHLFWIIAVSLLVKPISERLWPSSKGENKHQPSSQPSHKARQRSGARQRAAEVKAGPISETAAERLARLQKEREVVDREWERLTAKPEARIK